jgi:bacteriorhodopsin
MALDLVLIKMSFYVTYVLLITTGTITFIEALRTKTPSVRHILNLETCISIIAAFFYSQFVIMLDKQSIDFSTLNKTRYTDWFITTPLMLLALCLVLAHNNGSMVRLPIYVIILLLNFAMLWIGYKGERGDLDRRTACLLGFVPFVLMFALIWYLFIRNTKHVFNVVIYLIFVVVWSIYGFVYLADEQTKNIVYNALDAIAKCLIGLSLWAYFTKAIVA